MNDNKMNIFCWGFSKYGQTGLDNCQYTDEPNKLIIPIIKDVVSFSNGEFNSSFIFQDNKGYIYGLNTFGQLGNGANAYKSKKLSSIPLLIPKIKLKKLSLGGGHSLGLSIDNKLYSWGLNIFGQLGLGHNDNMDQPTLVEKLAFFENQTQEYDSTNLKETSFQSNQDIVDIKAGPQHSLILLSDNSIYSCGFAKFGALGYYFNNNNTNNNNNNEPNENNLFTKINLEKNFKFNGDTDKITRIAAGFAHSGCIINDKVIYIWGNNKNLKINGYKTFNISKLINKNDSENDDISIKDFQIGKDFAVILTNTGIVLTEGDNSLGQLGKPEYDENNENNEIFSKVEIPEKISDISVGYEFVYATSENKKIYAWGCNKYGQIPEFSKENICNKPLYLQKISNLNPVILTCGGYHVTALCKEDLVLNETVKYFKNIPLNKCFNHDDFRKREIFYERISETVDGQQQQYDALENQQKEYEKMLKDFEEKEQLKKIRDKGEECKTLEPEDYENIEIEKLLDEEIRYEELVFPEDCMIGSGAFGDVKKAYWRKTLVSVKFLKANFENKEKQVIPFIEEYNLLKQLRHPNILLYIGGNISGKQHFLITEYCENGNLFEFLHGKDAPDLEDVERLNLALEIAQGINYLHSFKPPILHRDLKSLNILLDKNFIVKIADFGWARLRDNHMTKLRGTFQWMAPEVISKDNYTEKADVYSFGIILWEFWSKEPPYKGVKAKEVAIKVRSNPNYRPIIPSEVPEDIGELMKCCWEADPEKRPTFLEIIKFLEDYLDNLP